MRPWFALFLFTGGALALVGFGSSSCSLNSAGGGGGGGDGGGGAGGGGGPGDGSVVEGSVPEASTSDANDGSMTGIPEGGCPGYVCNDSCVTSCTGCSAGETICASTRVCGHCGAACPGSELECFACPNGGAPESYCGAPANGCMPPIGTLTHCPCSTQGVQSCPGQTQVCFANSCITCGENDSDNLPCKDGMSCSENGGVCM